MHTQIPDGYKKVFNFSGLLVSGSVVKWNDFIGHGVIFWHHYTVKKRFYIPFVVEQVETPPFRTNDLFSLIHKGLGAEFVPLIKKGLDIYNLPVELKNKELLPFHLKIIMPTRHDIMFNNNNEWPRRQVKRLRGFLLRREDLVNE